MGKHSNLNPIFILWMKIGYFAMLSHKFNKYMKLVKIVMMKCWGLLRMNIQPPFINEEQAMKLINIHIDLCVKMFIKKIHIV